MSIEAITSTPCRLGEGLVWDRARQTLSWVDIPACVVHTWIDGSQREVVSVSARALSAAFPFVGRRGSWLLVLDQGFGVLDTAGSRPRVTRLDHSAAGAVRMNDAACDEAGRVWVGSMSMRGERGRGGLYRVDPDGSTHCCVRGLSSANGMGWSPDRSRFYLVDSDPGLIWSWDFNCEIGLASRRRLLVADVGRGIPDGLAVDVEGCLWVALYGAAEVRRFSSEGSLLEIHRLPVIRPTSVCFMGENEDVLCVASAQQDSPAAGVDGLLFALDVGVRGAPTHLPSDKLLGHRSSGPESEIRAIGQPSVPPSIGEC